MKDFDIINLDATHFPGHTEELKKDYFEACEWINSLGLNYRPTRFAAYKKDFELFFNPDNEDKINLDEDLLADLHTYMNASLEAVELIRIRNAFKEDNHKDFINILKKTLSGTPFKNSKNSDQSRNFTFELAVASRFLKAGYEVDLSSIADLICIINGRKIFIECKRIQSIRQLRKRVKEANKQVAKRLKKDNSIGSRGMVAISLTDIINPKSRVVVTKNIESLKKQNTDFLNGFVLNKSEDLSAGKDGKCLGILCEFSRQGMVLNEEGLVVSSRCSTIYTYFRKQNDKDFLNSFWEKLGNQGLN